MTTLHTGVARHMKEGRLHRLAMAAGLTKSSDELKLAWEVDPGLYLTTLKGANAAYDENKTLEGVLVACIARMASMVDQDDDVIDRAVEIVVASESMQS